MSARELAPWNWFGRKDVTSRDDYSPWKGVNQDIDRLFEEFTTLGQMLPRMMKENISYQSTPSIDLAETDKEYIVEADLPGVKAKDLDVSISKDGFLTLKGKRESKEEHKERNYYRTERSYGSFERTLALPKNCNTEKINATFKDGTLTLTLAKKEPSAEEVRKIPITSH